jgi:hypothetical protein
MLKEYTDVYKGYQIRSCGYLGKPPKDDKYRYDIVKWKDHEPYEVTDWETGEKKISTRSCYSVATLIYNPKEPDFELKSSGLRWLNEHPDPDVENWIIKWCEYKLHELYYNEEE